MDTKEYIGILVVRQENAGSKSEGPGYYLKLPESNEFGEVFLPIGKEAELWQEDPVLHPHVGKRVRIVGEPTYTKHVKFEGTEKHEYITYRTIEALE